MSSINCIILEKTCPRCGKSYPATSEFWYKHKAHKDGLASPCKHCRKEQDKDWRKNNPEKYRTKNAKWYSEHRLERKEYQRKWYVAHRKNAINHTEKWKRCHPEKRRQYNLKWQRANPDKIRSYNHRRNARRRSIPNTITEKDIQFAFTYFDNCCAVCGHQLNGIFTKPHFDHWIPLASVDCPGSIPGNMVPLCSRCNTQKGATKPTEWLIHEFGKRQASVIKKRIAVYFASLEKDTVR